MPESLLVCRYCRKSHPVPETGSPAPERCERCGGPLALYSRPGEKPQPKARARRPRSYVLPGQVIGDFLITGQLGEGGMSLVYRAENQRERREVALKIMRPDILEKFPEVVQRFKREAQAAADLEHPNIVRLFSVGECDGKYFIELEYIPGRSAKMLVERSGQLGVALSLAIVRDAALGLAEIHDRNIVHRDIKPDNILIHPDGVAKITDFGLAKGYGEHQQEGALSTQLTAPRVAVGTPDYISPEQCTGRELDGRADIYSLGCTLYFLLTAHRPFPGESNLAIMKKHLYEPVPDPSTLNPEVPRPVTALLQRMMAKEKDDRYPGARELVAGLEALDLPQPDPNSPNANILAKFLRRWPVKEHAKASWKFW